MLQFDFLIDGDGVMVIAPEELATVHPTERVRQQRPYERARKRT